MLFCKSFPKRGRNQNCHYLRLTIYSSQVRQLYCISELASDEGRVVMVVVVELKEKWNMGYTHILGKFT